MNIKNVLLTGGRAPVTLHLARSLNYEGLNVFVAESMEEHLCKYSNSVKKTFLVSKPKSNYKKYIEDLIKIIKENNIDFLIPTCEEIFYISKGLEKLQKHCKVLCEDIVKLRSLHNKWDFIQLLNCHGIKTPKTDLLTSKEDLNRFVGDMKVEDKYVFKPTYSRFGTKVFIVSGDNKKIPDIEINKDYTWVAQEFIKGEQYCTYSIAHNGKQVLFNAYNSPFTSKNGANVYFTSRLHREVIDVVREIIRKTKFTGQISFDIIVGEDGVAYPIECNPRTTSGIHHFSNDSLTDALFNNTDNKLYITSPLYNYMLLFPMLGYGLSLGYMFRMPIKWIISLFSAKDVIFSNRDIKPFFYQFKILFYLLRERRRKKKNITELSTEDIEWNGYFNK